MVSDINSKKLLIWGVTLSALSILSCQLLASEPVPALQAEQLCIAGDAGGFPCNRIDLLAHIPLSEMGGGNGADIWGWTDSTTGKEYSLVGRSTGTSFFDISNPTTPIYLGNLPPPTSNSDWRDIKVFNDYAFIVSLASNSGMQVFDLNDLRSIASPPKTFTAVTTYSGFSNAHNLVINEDSGFAYAVGGSDGDVCSGGLHMVDLQNPEVPEAAGCVSQDGYTHDAQCVNYKGPDSDYSGSEICLNSNENSLTLFDVTDKASPQQIARVSHSNVGYIHQGWLTEDHRYFVMGDELDEIIASLGFNTRTLIWDLLDLDSPQLIGEHISHLSAIDHNQYIVGDFLYQSNYTAGLRILNIENIALGEIAEIAFFDTFPTNDSTVFDGAWSVYPYYSSGIVTISDITNGLFIVRPNLNVIFSSGFE